MEAFDWFDDDEMASMPLRPPQDRLWRHPSELAAEGHFLTVVPEPMGRAWSGRSVAAGCALALATAAVATTIATVAVTNRHADLATAVITSTVTTVQREAKDLLNYMVDESGLGARSLNVRATPWLGISGADGPTAGVTISSVWSGSPAENVLLPGDVISAVDGIAVAVMSELHAILGLHQVGDVVRLLVIRAGQQHTMIVTLGQRLSPADVAPAVAEPKTTP